MLFWQEPDERKPIRPAPSEQPNVTHVHALTSTQTDTFLLPATQACTCVWIYFHTEVLMLSLCTQLAISIHFSLENVYTRAHTHTSLSSVCQRPLEMPANSSSEQQGVAFTSSKCHKSQTARWRRERGERGETRENERDRARENEKKEVITLTQINILWFKI